MRHWEERADDAPRVTASTSSPPSPGGQGAHRGSRSARRRFGTRMGLARSVAVGRPRLARGEPPHGGGGHGPIATSDRAVGRAGAWCIAWR